MWGAGGEKGGRGCIGGRREKGGRCQVGQGGGSRPLVCGVRWVGGARCEGRRVGREEGN